jgi:hypothetical protein
MAQSIKQINKKWKHELNRRRKNNHLKKNKTFAKQQNQRTRKLLIEDRRAMLEKREKQIDYVKALEKEII